MLQELLLLLLLLPPVPLTWVLQPLELSGSLGWLFRPQARSTFLTMVIGGVSMVRRSLKEIQIRGHPFTTISYANGLCIWYPPSPEISNIISFNLSAGATTNVRTLAVQCASMWKEHLMIWNQSSLHMKESTTMKFRQPETVGKPVLVLPTLHLPHKVVALTVGMNQHKPVLLILVLALLSAPLAIWDQQQAISASGWFHRAWRFRCPL